MELSGLILNQNVGKYPTGSWRFGKNIIISRDGKAILNEGGFSEYLALNMTIIGVIELGNTQILFSCNEVTSEIGIVVNEQYTTILRDQLLAFNLKYPIKGVATYNHKSEIVAAWTDDNVTMKVLNLATLPFPSGLNDVFGLINPNEFTLSELFPSVSNPNIQSVLVNDTGGSLKSGVYSFTIAYVFDDNSSTVWQELKNPIVITDDNSIANNIDFAKYDGCEAGTVTSKSITLNLNNLDSNFKRLKIGIVSKIGGIVEAFETEPIFYSLTAKVVVISTTNNLVQLSVKEIMNDTAVYVKGRAISLVGNRLHIGYPQGIPIIDFQSYANDISVQWYRDKYVSLDEVKTSYKDSATLFLNKEFKSGEVYALYIGLRLKQGGYYGVYHIPGREIVAGEDAALEAPFTNLATSPLKYQFLDTSSDESVAAGLPEGTIGKMSFWQNVNEIYPEDFPDLAGLPVRHHKFPSLAALEKYKADGSKLGFITPYNSITPESALLYIDNPSVQETTQVIPGYGTLSSFRVIFGTVTGTPAGELSDFNTKYTASENQTIDVDINLNIFTLDYLPITFNFTVKKVDIRNNTTILSTEDIFIDNYAFSCNLEDVFLEQGESLIVSLSSNNTFEVQNFGSYVSYDYDTQDQNVYGSIFTQPLGIKVSNVVIPAALQDYIDGWEIFYAERTIENMTCLAQDIIFGDNWKDGNYSYVDYIRSHNFDLMTNRLAISPTHLVKQLDFTLLTEDIDERADLAVVNYVDRTYTNCFALSDANRFIPIIPYGYFPAFMFSDKYDNENREDAYVMKVISEVAHSSLHRFLCDIACYKTDVYPNFQSQWLVSTGQFVNIGTTEAIIYGGDTVVSRYAYRLDYVDIVTPSSSRRLLPYIVAETVSNANLRHEGFADTEKYYPKSAAADVLTDEAIAVGNYWAYNNDYNAVNNYIQPVIYYPNIDLVDKFPGRIIRSLPKLTESVMLNWRTFLVNDYYEITTNRGAINVLTTDTNKKLYIGCEFATFLAKVKDSLDTNSGEIYLKEGDLFDREPDEIIPIEGGYIGNRCRFATFVCKYGYFTIDIDRGKIFLINNGVEEISKPWCDEFFENYLNVSSDVTIIDNEIEVSDGVSMDYDDNGSPVIYRNDYEKISNYKDNPFVSSGITACFDDRNDRFLITSNNRIYRNIADMEEEADPDIDNPGNPGAVGTGIFDVPWDIENKSYTISYHVSNKYWIALHDYLINHYIHTRTGVVGIRNLEAHVMEDFKSVLYKLNSEESYSRFENVIYPSFADFIFEFDKHNLIESIIWKSVVSSGRINYWDKTLTQVLLYTRNQCSLEIDVIMQTWANQLTTGNAKYLQGTWLLNKFNDCLVDPNLEFVDINGNLLTDVLADEEATEILVGREYIVSGIVDEFDYITYNSIDYTANNQRIAPVNGITTFTKNGNAIVKNFKNWFDKSNFYTIFAVVRAKYDNIEQLAIRLTDITLNAK